MTDPEKDINKEPILIHNLALIEVSQLMVIASDIKIANVYEGVEKRRAIYRAAIVYLCASWETFLEAVVNIGVDIISREIKSPDLLSHNIHTKISERLIQSKDPRDIWKISGDGWRNELKENANLLLSKFNNARPKKVDELIFNTLGIRNISNQWKWTGQSAEQSKKKLNHFIDLRGDIAHRIFTKREVHDRTISMYGDFIWRITCITSNHIGDQIFKSTGKHPWHKGIPDEKLFG